MRQLGHIARRAQQVNLLTEKRVKKKGRRNKERKEGSEKMKGWVEKRKKRKNRKGTQHHLRSS